MNAERPESAAVREAVRDILSTVGARPDLTRVSDTDSLLASGVVDSMAMVDLVAALEARFGIRVEDTELTPEHFDTVAAIVSLVSAKAGAS